MTAVKSTIRVLKGRSNMAKAAKDGRYESERGTQAEGMRWKRKEQRGCRKSGEDPGEDAAVGACSSTAQRGLWQQGK